MAPTVDINYFAVLVSAVASFAIGFLWHGPLFGKQWMRLMGFTEKSIKKMKLTPVQAMVGGFIATLLMSYIFAHFIDYVRASTIMEGVTAGFWIWLGFVATIMLNGVLWENRPFKLYLLNVSYHLVTLAVMGAILAVWV